MKRSSTPYWVLTGLLAAIMLSASVPDVLRVPLAVGVFMHLGYPSYLLPFIGVAKLLGVLALVAPELPRLKEWAYAGLTFDLIGALYSHLSVGDPLGAWFPAAIALLLVRGSYALHRRLSGASRDASPW